VSAAPGSRDAPLVVPVWYDFASSLCYVAHRVLQAMAPETDALGIAFDWRPLDLAALRGLRRGAALRPADRERVAVVAREHGVPLRIPGRWLDARAVLAAAAVAPAGRAATWRERVFSAVYEAGEAPETPAEVLRLARELELPLDAADLEAGARRVACNTAAAREAEVTGVPAFQLGRWPFGGIQHRDTMRHVLERYAQKAREGALLS